MTSRYPCAFSYQLWTGFVILVVCVRVTDKWWQQWLFSVIMPDQGGMWHEPCPCQRCPQLLSTQMHNLPPLQPWHQYLRGRGTGTQGRKESPGSHMVRSIVVAEQFAQKKTLAVDAKRVCTRMVFRNSNRTLSVLKDSCERFVCPKPKSKSLLVINTLR